MLDIRDSGIGPKLHDVLLAEHDIGAVAQLAREEVGASDIIFRRGRARFIIKGRNRFADMDLPLEMHIGKLLDNVRELIHNSENEFLNKRWTEDQMVDFSLDLPDSSLARVHVYETDDSSPAVAIRIQSLKPPTLDKLLTGSDKRIARILENLKETFSFGNGLNAIGGPVRSGKTTLAHALYNYINTTPTDEPVAIVMVADPPEYRHDNLHADIQVQTIGRSAKDYETATAGALRIPHDICDIGEYRMGAKAARMIMNAIIRGSQVNLTAHTYTLSEMSNRFTGEFSGNEQEHHAAIFRDSTRGLYNLRLVPTKSGEETLAVQYVNFVRLPAKREDLKNPRQLEGSLDSAERDAAQSLEADLADLASSGVCDPAVVRRFAVNKTAFDKRLTSVK